MMRRYTWHGAARVRVVSESFVCDVMGNKVCVRESDKERKGGCANKVRDRVLEKTTEKLCRDV